MRDDIPPDVLNRIQALVANLRYWGRPEPLIEEWLRGLGHTRRTSIAKKRGRPAHPYRRQITARLRAAKLTGKRGALARAIRRETEEHGLDPRTLLGWVEYPNPHAEDWPGLRDELASAIAAQIYAKDPEHVPKG